MPNSRPSLLIPTWNGMPLLAEVLAAVDAQRDAGTLERIAVDSGSTDGTIDCLAQHGFSVHSIPQSEFNHGATRDLGIDRATGDVVVLLTQDAVPADDSWLASLLSAYDDESVGAAYCRQIPRSDCNPFIAHRLREWSAGKTEPVLQRLAGDQRFEELEPMQRLQLCAYDNVAGSVRRAAWNDHHFGHRRFGEDVAFGKKLILDGWTIAFRPDSAVVHSHNRSPREEGKRIFCDHQNLRDLFDVHLVPSYRQFKENAAWAKKSYGQAVLDMDLPEPEKRELLHWAQGYAWWATLGMYLGGNSARLSRGWRKPLFTLVDRWMHKGI